MRLSCLAGKAEDPPLVELVTKKNMLLSSAGSHGTGHHQRKLEKAPRRDRTEHQKNERGFVSRSVVPGLRIAF